jgi:diguanylate cyclase (GGDEF)-like protein
MAEGILDNFHQKPELDQQELWNIFSSRPEDSLSQGIFDSMRQQAETLRNSPDEYTKHIFGHAEGFIRAIQAYQEKGVPSEAITEILAAELAKSELQGLTDRLTGLANEKGFDETLEDDIAHATRRNEPLVIGYMDLVGFKAVNDAIGHDAGDRVLQLVAEYLKKHVREGDFTARLHGDEFAIIFRGEDTEEVQERFASSFNEGLGSYLQQNMPENTLPVGARIGFQQYSPDFDVSTFKNAADQQMNALRESDPNSR